MLNISYCTWEKWCVCAVFAVQGVLVAKFKKKQKNRVALLQYYYNYKANTTNTTFHSLHQPNYKKYCTHARTYMNAPASVQKYQYISVHTENI